MKKYVCYVTYDLEKDNKMKKKVIVILVIFLGTFLTICLTNFGESDKKENLSSLSKRMEYKNVEKMLQEMKEKTVYTSKGKVFVDNKNTGINSSLKLDKKDNLYVEELGIENNKLIIKCSNGQKVSLVSLKEKEKKEITKIINEKDAIDVAENNDKSTIQKEKKQCELIVSKKETNLGNEVEVPIKIRNNPGVLGMTISIIYDDQYLELKDVKNGEAFSNILQFTKPNKFYNGCICLWDGIEIENQDIKDGVIATLVFYVSDKATSKTYSIGIECKENDAINNNLETIDVRVNNGQIKIN